MVKKSLFFLNSTKKSKYSNVKFKVDEMHKIKKIKKTTKLIKVYKNRFVCTVVGNL